MLFYLIQQLALTFWEKESADLPYIRSGLVQPLISYGEVCAYTHTPTDIRFARKIPFEVPVRPDN